MKLYCELNAVDSIFDSPGPPLPSPPHPRLPNSTSLMVDSNELYARNENLSGQGGELLNWIRKSYRLLSPISYAAFVWCHKRLP